MSYDVLEKEIRQLPESYLEDVSKYIQFLLYQYEQERIADKGFYCRDLHLFSSCIRILSYDISF